MTPVPQDHGLMVDEPSARQVPGADVAAAAVADQSATLDVSALFDVLRELQERGEGRAAVSASDLAALIEVAGQREGNRRLVAPRGGEGPDGRGYAAFAPRVVPGLSDEDLMPYVRWQRAQGLSETTVLGRWDFARMWFERWGRWDVPADHVAMWLARYLGWTRLTYMNNLRSLYGWLVEAGVVAEDPTARIKRPPTPRPDPNPLSPAELAAVLEWVDDPPDSNPNDDIRAWVYLAYLAGLRCHEIAKFRGEDITETSIRVAGKGGRVETIPTHPDLWDLAQGYPRQGYWFPSPYRHTREHRASRSIGTAVSAMFRRLGIEKGSIHRLRATYGTELVRAGVDINTVRDLMRHRSLNATQVYLGLDEDTRRRAISRLSGGAGALSGRSVP
jgi:integrase/recombinase XerD